MDARLTAYLEALEVRSGSAPDGPSVTNASPDVSFRKQVRTAGLLWRVGTLVAAHLMDIGLLLASWGFVGYSVLSGRVENASLAAWALCLASTVPLRLATCWLTGVIAVGLSGLLKQRLLVGAIRIDPDFMRGKGAGELLGEVLETEAIERLGTSGGIEILLAALELLLVPFLLLWGAAPGLEIALLEIWIILSLILIGANTRRRIAWTNIRLTLTHRLVEKMSAHRTRMVQQPPSQWHSEEDREVRGYAASSELLDRSTAIIEGGLSRAYVVASLAALAPSFFGGGATLGKQAVTFGAILFAAAALERLTFGFSRGAAAWVAWSAIKPMFDSGAQPLREDVPELGPPALNKLLQARDLIFTYQGRAEPVVSGCTLTIERGDFLLLEGDSGSGKSTLVALLAGLRKPESGVLLAGGLDRQTLGDQAWRRRIAAAPQYHENHILSAPLSFNLLLGRPYPHSEPDVREAKEVCLELGLGPLLERMPAGLDQMVGETGWQLSQGERSRVFLARALLQGADMVILDESLAALDPENLQQCLECVLRRAKTLLVIAHP
jgi:ATP-binding cassette subfamily B protein